MDHAAAFAVARLEPARDGAADLVGRVPSVLGLVQWPRQAPLPQRDIAAALLTLFEAAHLPVALVDGRRVVQGAIVRDDG